MFEEKSFNEFKKDYLFDFEAYNVNFNYLEAFRAFLLTTPLSIIAYFLVDSYLEVYIAKSDVNLMTEQELKVLNESRKKQ